MRSPLHLVISLDEQSLRVVRAGQCVGQYAVSTSARGMGFGLGSYQTPCGRFRICEKIGVGEPLGTIFQGRKAVGQWDQGRESAQDEDLILSRILRLEGLDADNANTLERCIYLHGTNREDLMGQPASHGCVRLRNADIIELFAEVAVGDFVEILAPGSAPRHAL